MKIMQVFEDEESNVLYFSCISKGYRSRVFLKKEKSATPTRINFEEWGKINSKKELKPKKLKRHITQGVVKFLSNLMTKLEERAVKKDTLHPFNQRAETLVRAKPIYKKVGNKICQPFKN